MATRFYLPSAGTAAVSPPISATDWQHINPLRRPLNSAPGTSPIATTTYSPDTADHLVFGRSHICQFVSEVLEPQTIPAQQVKLQVRCRELATSDNLYLNWKIHAVSEDGQAVLGALVAMKGDGLEAAGSTQLVNRSDIATSTAFESSKTFRLVAEMGLGGTPTLAGGIDGHNAEMSFGENAATDLPEDDTSTAALNPWLQFSRPLAFRNPPPPPAGRARVEMSIAKGDPQIPEGWVVSAVILSAMVQTDQRARFATVFAILGQLQFDHDDILVWMTSDALTQEQIDRLVELSKKVVNSICILENGLRLSDLTPEEIRARVG